MKTSEQINEVATASSKAQGSMKPATKDSENPHFRSKYADLAAIWEACRGPLSANGLTVWQDVTTTEDGVAVTTRLVHSSGQWIEFGPLTVPLSKHDAHGVGSATSYAKRYALAAAIGVTAEDDDDGNAAAASAPAKRATLAAKRDDRSYAEKAKDAIRAVAKNKAALSDKIKSVQAMHADGQLSEAERLDCTVLACELLIQQTTGLEECAKLASWLVKKQEAGLLDKESCKRLCDMALMHSNKFQQFAPAAEQPSTQEQFEAVA